MYSCNKCNLSFDTVSCKANHDRWHHKDNSATVFLRFCSCLECKQEISVQNIKKHLDKHVNEKQEKQIKSHCAKCSKPIYSNNKFCSHSCAASYSNKLKPAVSKTTKEKISNTNKNKPKVSCLKCKQEISLLNIKVHVNSCKGIKYCYICNAIHHTSGKTCSMQCKKQLLSLSLKEAITNGSFNPQLNRKGRFGQSYMEKTFEDILAKRFPYLVFEKEKHFYIKEINKNYFSDFVFTDLKLIVELDGNQHLDTINEDKLRDDYISKEYNFKTIRIPHSEFIKSDSLEKYLILLGHSSFEL